MKKYRFKEMYYNINIQQPWKTKRKEYIKKFLN